MKNPNQASIVPQSILDFVYPVRFERCYLLSKSEGYEASAPPQPMNVLEEARWANLAPMVTSSSSFYFLFLFLADLGSVACWLVWPGLGGSWWPMVPNFGAKIVLRGVNPLLHP